MFEISNFATYFFHLVLVKIRIMLVIRSLDYKIAVTYEIGRVFQIAVRGGGKSEIFLGEIFYRVVRT